MSVQQLDQRILGIEQIEVNTCGYHNARTFLGDLTELRDSIREKGLLTPPVVWETTIKGKTHYVLLAGHRRLEAIRQIREEMQGEELPFDELTCSVYDGPLDGAMTAGLVDNIQRESLNPADQAEAVYKLTMRVGNQEKVGHMLGKSQPWVSNYVSLYRCLIPEAMDALRREQIRVNQAKKLAMMVLPDKTPDVEAQTAALNLMLNPDDGEGREPEASQPKEERAKTSRSKKEVSELAAELRRLLLEDQEFDVQYRRHLLHMIRWFYCEIETAQIVNSSSMEVAPPELPEAPEPAKEEAEPTPEPPKKKRRLADVKA